MVDLVESGGLVVCTPRAPCMSQSKEFRSPPHSSRLHVPPLSRNHSVCFTSGLVTSCLSLRLSLERQFDRPKSINWPPRGARVQYYQSRALTSACGQGCRTWRSNPSGKCSRERLTRGTVISTMRRAAHPSGSARCGADADCLVIRYQSLWGADVSIEPSLPLALSLARSKGS